MIALIGGNELGPVDPLQCSVIVIFMIAAALINANIFGEMSYLTTIINKKTNEYQGKVDTANTAMQNIQLEALV
jgi:archaellum component FlaG (FlaF/FlaG flagellin family)